MTHLQLHPPVAEAAKLQSSVAEAARLQISTLARLMLMVLIAGWLVGCTQRATTPQQRQKRAIESINGRSWFDSKTSAYQPPPVSDEFDDPLRTKGWVAPAKANTPAPPPGKKMNWSGLGDGLTMFVWFVLLLTLVGLAALLAMVSMKTWDRTRLAPKRTLQIEIDPTRIVDLPFDAVDEMRDPLERARQLASAGDYNAAILFLYGYMLLALDRAGKLVLHRGKTNRMYLLELGSDRRLRDLLSPAVLAFEEVYFGRYTLQRARFMSLWQSLDEFHQHLSAIMAAQTAAQEAAVLAGSPAPGSQEVSAL